MSEKKATLDRKVELTLPEALQKLDDIQLDIVEKTNLYHHNVKGIVDTLISQLEPKSKIIKP